MEFVAHFGYRLGLQVRLEPRLYLPDSRIIAQLVGIGGEASSVFGYGMRVTIHTLLLATALVAITCAGTFGVTYVLTGLIASH